MAVWIISIISIWVPHNLLHFDEFQIFCPDLLIIFTVQININQIYDPEMFLTCYDIFIVDKRLRNDWHNQKKLINQAKPQSWQWLICELIGLATQWCHKAQTEQANENIPKLWLHECPAFLSMSLWPWLCHALLSPNTHT